MFVLAIDTSNMILSVALVENKQTLIEINEQTKNNHSERLMPVIEQAFQEVDRQVSEIDLIAVAKGPGSYTGVRIGVTVAKTLAWTLNIPLVGVSSLEVLVGNVKVDGLIIPLFDARRENVFAGVYHGSSHEWVIEDGHYSLNQLLQHLAHRKENLYFIGCDVFHYWKCITGVLGAKAHNITDESLNVPHGSVLANLAISKAPVENVHTFAPHYHRLPEAEVNWLKSQKEQDNG